MSGRYAILWSGKPYIRKTLVKAFVLFLLTCLPFAWMATVIPLLRAVIILFVAYALLAWIFVAFYVYWKRAHTYYVKDSGILITRDWVFGRYQREITFDRIQDVHVQQGILARLFRCGSVVFVTAAGLEVGYAIVGGGRYVHGGGVAPRLIRGAWNSFIDVQHPEEVRETVMRMITAWREAYQQQRMAKAVETISERMVPGGVSVADELAKLKDLLDRGVITREEYEKAKKRILGE